MVSAGYLWHVPAEWSWRVWSIGKNGQIVFSDVRYFKDVSGRADYRSTTRLEKKPGQIAQTTPSIRSPSEQRRDENQEKAITKAPELPKPDGGFPASFKPIEQSRFTKLIGVAGSQAWKHGGPVEAVAVSPDGRTAVSGGLDGVALLWDLETGDCLRTLAALGHWVMDVAFLPDGKSVLIAPVGGNPEVVDVATGKKIRSIDIGSDPRHHSWGRVAIFPDGKRVVIESGAYPCLIINMEDGKLLKTLWPSEDKQHASDANRVSSPARLAVTPDGSRVLVGNGRKLDVFDVASGNKIRSIEKFNSYVASIAVARDGKTCLAGDGDGTVRLLDLVSGEEIRAIEAHTIRVEAIGFANDDTCAFTGSDDYSFALFNLKDGREIWRTHGPAVRCVAMTADKKGAFTGSIHHGVMLWDLKTGAARGKVTGHGAAVTSVEYVGNQIVTGCPDRTIRFWDANGHETKQLFRGYGRSTLVAAKNANVLVIGGYRGIGTYDLRTGYEKRLPASENVELEHARRTWIGHDGKTIIGLDQAFTLKEWDLETDAEPRSLVKLGAIPFCVASFPRFLGVHDRW